MLAVCFNRLEGTTKLGFHFTLDHVFFDNATRS